MKKYELIVVGGGISGVSASVAAARQGLKVLLIEKFGSLGGAMSNSLVYPFMPHRAKGKDGKVTSAGLFNEIKNRHFNYGDASWETFKFVFDDMTSEAGVQVLFHSAVYEAVTEDKKITGVKVASKGNILE